MMTSQSSEDYNLA